MGASRIAALAVWLLVGCGPGTDHVAPGAAPTPTAPAERLPQASPADAFPPLAALAPVTAGRTLAIRAGTVLAGSRPGEPGRRPQPEADLVAVAVPAFEIDQLPYPNDPARAARRGTTRPEAAALCAEGGKRLCTELEWERACKADTAAPYPTGATLDMEACGLDPRSCPSPLGVLVMGALAYEWTASDVSRGLGSDRYRAVTRGAPIDAPLGEHRCGARHAHDPTRAQADTTFRCCQGPLPELTYPAEEAWRPFRLLDVDRPRLRQILATTPALAPYASSFRMWGPDEIDRALSRSGRTRESLPWTVLDSVLRWSPEPGELAWVFAGVANGSAMLVVIHPMPDGTFVHGASFILHEERAPIVLTWDYGSRTELHWSARWGEVGEGGVVRLREDHRIVVIQR